MISKIMIVDYSVLRQQMYRSVLSRYHATFVNALNGQAALDLLATQPDIELVILDVNIAMAGMSGLEFLEEVARLGIISRIPVVLIGMAGKEVEISRGLELGARESILRPFNPARLHDIIEKIVAREQESGNFKGGSCSQKGSTMMTNFDREVVAERIYWRGTLTRSVSMALGGELLEALKRNDTLTVNLDGVEFLDYSCLVLLCAVKRQASEKGKDVSLEGLSNRVVAPLVQRYRINGNRLCRAYCGQSCLFD